MSEAYACDRCGKLRESSPYAALRVEQGYRRSHSGEERISREGQIRPGVNDLCRSCINDLRKWYADGGGDRDDISGDWLNDADAVEDTDE